MKFSDVNEQNWSELRPYVDTCILPVTGLSGLEQPWQATRALEELRDALDLFEIPYKGRVLTYPAYHYIQSDQETATLNEICRRLKECGFPYVVAVSASLEHRTLLGALKVDLAFTLPPQLLEEALPETKQQISEALMHLWTTRK